MIVSFTIDSNSYLYRWYTSRA